MPLFMISHLHNTYIRTYIYFVVATLLLHFQYLNILDTATFTSGLIMKDQATVTWEISVYQDKESVAFGSQQSTCMYRVVQHLYGQVTKSIIVVKMSCKISSLSQ